MRRIFIVMLLSVFLTKSNWAQTPEIDELKKNLALAKTDSARVSTLQKICATYINSDPDSVRHYANKLKRYIANPEFQSAKQIVTKSYGAYHFYKSNFDSAIYYFEKNGQFALEDGDSMAMAKAYTNVGAVCSSIGQSERSLEFLFEALRMIESVASEKSLPLLNVLNNIARVYQGLQNYRQSLLYLHQAFDVSLSIADKTYQARITENMGSIYGNLSRQDSALLYLHKSLKLTKKLNQELATGIVTMKIGEMFILNDEFDSAKYYLKESLSFFDESDYVTQQARIHGSLGNLYFKQNEYRKALREHQLAISIFKKAKSPHDEVLLLEHIANDFKSLGKINEAFEALYRHKLLQDSLFSQQKAEASQEMQVKYETEKKEKELALQSAQLSEQQFKLEQQQLLKNIAIGGTIFLSLVAFLIYWIKTKSNREISDKNDQLGKSLSERESLLKEIHHRVKNNLQIIASLLYLQSDDTENKNVNKLLEEGQGRVRSMALIHQKLYENDDLKSIPFEEYLKELIGEIQHSFGQSAENIQLEVNAKDIYFDVDTAVPLGLIINELSTNAFKYAYSKRLGGTFKVKLEKDVNTYKMQVADDGIGIPDDQLNNSQSKSLGLKLTKMLSDQLEGEYAFNNAGGTTFDLKFAV